MRRHTIFGILFTAIAAMGCAGGPDQDLASISGGSNLDPNSLEYFRVQVGDRVFFATDRVDLSPEARSVLDRQAEWLRLNPEVRVTIEGHADERGTREYNLALGARRADAVQGYLVTRGVAQSRVNTVTFGRERPVEICSSDPCWSKNRRAVTAPQ